MARPRHAGSLRPPTVASRTPRTVSGPQRTECLAARPECRAKQREVFQQESGALAHIWRGEEKAQRHDEHAGGGDAPNTRRARRPPPSCDQERDDKLHDSDDFGAALETEDRIEPEDERAVTDE